MSSAELCLRLTVSRFIVGALLSALNIPLNRRGTKNIIWTFNNNLCCCGNLRGSSGENTLDKIKYIYNFDTITVRGNHGPEHV